jgi:hypothetical protein
MPPVGGAARRVFAPHRILCDSFSFSTFSESELYVFLAVVSSIILDFVGFQELSSKGKKSERIFNLAKIQPEL